MSQLEYSRACPRTEQRRAQPDPATPWTMSSHAQPTGKEKDGDVDEPLSERI